VDEKIPLGLRGCVDPDPDTYNENIDDCDNNNDGSNKNLTCFLQPYFLMFCLLGTDTHPSLFIFTKQKEKTI